MRWLLCCCCYFIAFAAFSQGRPTVLFVNPSFQDDAFFMQVEALGRIAAMQLGLEFTVINGEGNRLIQQQKLAEYLKKQHPDYAIVQPYTTSGLAMMQLLTEHQVNIITLEHMWQPAEQTKVGRPGEKFPNWLAEVYYNNVLASAQLTIALQQACPDSNELIGINGLNNNETDARAEGAYQAMRQRGGTVHQIVSGKWERQIAAEQTLKLLRRYPKSQLVWAASDWMALGVIDALGQQAGRDFCIGGFDWIPEAQKALADGKLTASAGGHFAMTAWALVLIYDHVHGKLPQPLPDIPLMQMDILTKENLARYRPLLRAGQWQRIDFKKFSLTNNPTQQQYQFSIHRALQQLIP